MPIDIEEAILATDASGAPVRLEYVRGRTKWELSPTLRHQKTIDRIRSSIGRAGGAGGGSGCGCHSCSDVLIRFDGPEPSFKRPDIAIFCEEPPDTDHALDVLPAAVIEILSRGYEEKDLGEDGAPFYLEQGIADVIVVDPRSGEVRHYRPDQPVALLGSPTALSLACGSDVTC